MDGLRSGRIYDMRLARFLQPDPFIQEPDNSQNWNRYTYLWNNPLNATDPSGYLGAKERQWLAVIYTAVTIWIGNVHGIYAMTAPCGAVAGQAIAYVAVNGAVAGAISSGTWEGAAWGAFGSLVFFGIGEQFAGGDMFTKPWAAKVAAHGMAGGVLTTMQGGKFGHGFASAGVTEAFADQIDAIGDGHQRYAPARVIAAAVVGGTASALSGGKFANGALMGAFSRAFNDEPHNCDEQCQVERDLRGERTPVDRAVRVGQDIAEVGAVVVEETWWQSAAGKIFGIFGRSARPYGANRSFRNLAPGDEIGRAVVFPAHQIRDRGYSGRLNYVVTESGDLVIGRTGHTSLSGGANVLAAGEARFVEGALRSLNNASGHYRPSGSSAQRAAESAFEQAGFAASGRYIERSF